MPLVSVIIPAFNAARTIASSLASVLDQSHSELEVIVVDDGSTDATVEVVEALGEARVRVSSFENAGQATARNRGMAEARGAYLTFLDADDLWTPDKLEAQVAALEDQPDADVAYSWTDIIDEEDRLVRTGSHHSANGEVLESLVQVNFIESGSNLLVRRAAVERVGGFAPELVPAEDWDWNLRLAEQARFVAVPRVQVLYRSQSSSQSSDVDRMLDACTACLQRALERSPQSDEVRRSAFANIHCYLLHKLLEFPAPEGRASGTLSRALRLVSGILRNDRAAWRSSGTRRALARAWAFSLLPGPWLSRIDRRETTLTRRVARKLSLFNLLNQIRVR